jgi:hypothetical protein
MPKIMKRFCLALALVLGASRPGWAWGVEGHEVVAALAARHLTPRAAAQVGALLGAPAQAAMIADANWADEIRDRRPQTGRWHFVNIPVSAAGYDARRDCPMNDCIVAQIGRQLALLGNRRAPRPARVEALRFVIHFVADIHQPLHAADNGDRGGNDVHVRIRGTGIDTSMHQLWDTRLVQGSGRDPIMLAARIARDIPPATWRAWQAGTPAAWADQSLYLAQADIYGPAKGRRNLRLDRAYVAREAPVVRLQLGRAGARLAWLLNRALN